MSLRVGILTTPLPVMQVRRGADVPSGPEPLRHVLSVRVCGFVLGYPFATQDTKRNSSDECARDPNRLPDLRQRTTNQRQGANLVTQFVGRTGGTLTQFQLCLRCNS